MIIVSTNVPYNSSILKHDLMHLKQYYPFIKIQTIGNSVLGKPLYVVKLGYGPNKVFYSAGFHANEWITSILLMKYIEDYSNSFFSNTKLYDYSIRNLFKSSSVYIMPMCNPDGIDLVTEFLEVSSPYYQKALHIANEFPKIPFPNGWKANINGVDLNLQFPAGWDQARKNKYSQGFNRPSPRDFVGYGPLTEPESLAIYNFTISNDFRLVISFHTQGKEIYWQFQDYAPKEAKDIGKTFASVSGYTLTNPEYHSSFAGYKDWFLQEYKRPGYTIEAGFGKNPLPISQFDEIYRNVIEILVLGMVL